jgi:hypothetical protein
VRIKFSHKYRKVLDENGICVDRVKLLEVVNVKLEGLSPVFLNYDTDFGLFKLPKKGKYMMLVFEKPCNHIGGINLFTTLRRWTEEKERYYRGAIGAVFVVEYMKGTLNGDLQK